MDEWEYSDFYCPKCQTQLRQRECDNFYCEDGYVDLYEEDPLWYEEGDLQKCPDCNGNGYFRWCSNEDCDVSEAEINKAVLEQCESD